MTRRGAALLVVATLGVAVAGCSSDDADGGSVPIAPPRPTTTVAGASSSTVPGSAAPSPTDAVPTTLDVQLTQVATAAQPIAMSARPRTDEVYVAERAGTVRRFTVRNGAWADEGRVLDIRRAVGSAEGERGLLGVAVTPEGDRLVVSYTDSGDDGASVLASYALADGRADPASRIEILRLPQPYPNHNGGNIRFGPDGELYVGFGDGGSQGDPDDRAQDLGDLLGKVLRIDIRDSTKDEPYRIPADNPYVGRSGARGEIWLRGVRNPWRFSFDRATGDLWIGDVGGAEWEEVDLLPAASGAGRGANLGWRLKEGPDDTDKPGDRSALVDPVTAYHHNRGQSVVGGVVVRGAAAGPLAGVYLYCDAYQPDLRAIVVRDGQRVGEPTMNMAGGALEQAVSFGEDADGAVYVLSLTGTIRRVDPA